MSKIVKPNPQYYDDSELSAGTKDLNINSLSVGEGITYGTKYGTNIGLSLPSGNDIPPQYLGNCLFSWKNNTTTAGNSALYIKNGYSITNIDGTLISTIVNPYGDIFFPLLPLGAYSNQNFFDTSLSVQNDNTHTTTIALDGGVNKLKISMPQFSGSCTFKFNTTIDTAKSIRVSAHVRFDGVISGNGIFNLIGLCSADTTNDVLAVCVAPSLTNGTTNFLIRTRKDSGVFAITTTTKTLDFDEHFFEIYVPVGSNAYIYCDGTLIATVALGQNISLFTGGVFGILKHTSNSSTTDSANIYYKSLMITQS